MNKKTLLSVGIALGVTGIVFMGGFLFYKEKTKPQSMVEVAVTTKGVKAGEYLSSENYNYVSIPEKDLTESHITKMQLETENSDKKKVYTLTDVLKGKEVVADLYPNEPIMKGRLSGMSNLTNENGEKLDLSKYRKMTYSVSDTSSLEGQVKVGDKVDFWVTYKLTDTKNSDQLIIVDKVLKNIVVNRTFDGNGQEIKDVNIPSATIELLVLEEEYQQYLQYKALGTFSIVKAPINVTTDKKNEIVRRKVSTKDLIWEILSMETDAVTADKIKKDPKVENKIPDIEIESPDKKK